MNNIELKKLLLDIPIKLCRNMKNEFGKSILKDLDLDFSLQHLMVLKLLEGDKKLYVTEFVSMLSITKPQMTSLIDKLIEMAYVTRTNDIVDRRKVYISLTNEGENILSNISNRIDSQLDSWLVAFTQEELETLEKGLEVLQKLCLNCNN
ncbi:MAG: MarR family transcriptional regulator [Bacteroidales bacterium]|nr:MarR family transcriptional regulator [Bacteroidales bacterium]